MSDQNYSLGAVPQSARKSVLSLSMVMLGFTFFSASMWTGGTLGKGLSFDGFFLAVFVGNLLLGIYTSFLGYIGASSGLSTSLLARFTFGTKGSWLPSLILGGTQVGWFGVGVAMFALPVQRATGLSIETLILIAGLTMTATVYFGISALMILSTVAVPAIALLGGYSVIESIRSVGGLEQLKLISPESPISFSTALVLVIGSFIAGGTLTADFVRFGKSPKTAVLVTMLAFFIGNSLMFIFGGAGAAVTGKSDISEVMMMQGLIIPAILVLGLNIWTTNDNALYASGLGLSNITGLPSKYLSVANGIIGTLCALWLYNNFVSWLIFLSSAIPPIGGIIIVDFIRHREDYKDFAHAQFKTVRWTAIFGLVTGIIAGQFLPGIVPLNAVLSGGLSYLMIDILSAKLKNSTLKEGESRVSVSTD